MSSKGGGLIIYDYKQNIVKQLTTDEGLSNNVIYAALEDDQKNMWIPSNLGLMQIDKESFEIKTYLEKDGIANNEFNTCSYLKSEI